jgi:Ca-activated chloride channel homolog
MNKQQHIFPGLVYTVVFLFVMLSAASKGQVNSYLRKGNDAYEKKNFMTAEKYYSDALNKLPDSYGANFNLGDALYQQKRYKESTGYFQRANDLAKTNQEKELSYYNLGNSYLKQEDIDASISAFKSALKINPDNLYAKSNLSYALLKRKQKQKQQQQQQSMKMPSPQQPDNQDNKKPQEKNKEQQQQQAQNQLKEDQTKISDAEAEKILDALKNNEQNIRQRMYDNRRKPMHRRPEKPW